MDDQWLNILVEREVLNSDRKTTAGHVELLVDGFHLLPQNVNLLDGEWFEKVLQEVHLIVKRFHLQVSEEDVGKILTELVRINLCQLGSASESTSISLEGVVFMLD